MSGDGDIPKEHYWSVQAVHDDKARCLFCEADLAGARSKEHVIPQWLLREFDVEAKRIEPTWMSAANGYQPRDQRRHDLSNLVHGRVCATCNNGWMSELETDVRDTLLSLAEGHSAIQELYPDRRRVLTRWALKTAAVLNGSSNFHNLVSQRQARSAMTGEPAEGVVVVGRQLGPEYTGELTWDQTAGIAQVLRPPDVPTARLEEHIAGAWRIVLGVGRLLLLTVYLRPSEDWRLCFERRLHEPIWPLTGLWPFYDASEPPDDHRLSTEVFHTTMSLRMIATDDDVTPTEFVLEDLRPADQGPVA